jgi:hypothetical protein
LLIADLICRKFHVLRRYYIWVILLPMCANNSFIYRISMHYSNKCVAKRSCNQCKVMCWLIWAFFINASKSYVSITNIFKICYKRYLSFLFQKINEKSKKRSSFFKVKEEWDLSFSNSRRNDYLVSRKMLIFKSDFHDRISKQISGKWKWFFNRNLKNVGFWWA